ncbi:tRNA guanosine(34) transglycosylase Tgt [Algisphaera agarilytica]|uniref:Queuine tRNA-ribosyltransferase n=1 Tax=Algisphaera agarilytica TaxID=1385975 RepID=A0A7X0LL31_9BACT|nr:tRNA guanosine(34) transglycosylase Tgt [Algisphaera agarilytica]MBB6430577.1 queuine tRNA-ribosyltransferase [Algisphaera agarilytica]
MSAISYELLQQDETSNARLGRVTTPHGSFDTPAFMPVGTQGTIKGLLPQSVADTGAQIVLGNTYHLLLRPGSELIAKMGGLQDWTGWRGPMLTDSGGFQVFSLGNLNKIDDDGVKFKSHLDGAEFHLTPERSMLVQEQLGADIIMAFDDCPPAAVEKLNPRNVADSPVRSDSARTQTAEPAVMTPAEYAKRVEIANERTLRWLDRCVKAHRASGRWDEQGLFGIVQGGTDLDQRTFCAEQVTQHDLPGFAIGGVAVGEGSDEIRSVVEHTAPLLPSDKPRYLMGVGYERDIVAAVRAGVDMFDCVLPTRNGRNASAFTSTGLIRLKNAKFAEDPRPIEEGCDCVTCTGFSRSYIRHLFQANEMLGGILVSLHNLRHFQRLLLDIRGAIRDNAWSSLAERWPVAFPAGA